MRFKELPKKWKVKIIILSVISVLFAILLVAFNIFLNSYREENERQRAKLVKNDSELIGERIEVQRDGKASVKANLYMPDNIGICQTILAMNYCRLFLIFMGAALSEETLMCLIRKVNELQMNGMWLL